MHFFLRHRNVAVAVEVDAVRKHNERLFLAKEADAGFIRTANEISRIFHHQIIENRSDDAVRESVAFAVGSRMAVGDAFLTPALAASHRFRPPPKKISL